MSSRIWISLVFLLSACGADEFSTMGGSESSPGSDDEGPSTSDDAGGASDGAGSESRSTADSDAPEAEPDWIGWEGTRVGPSFDEVDPTLGNYAQDLPAPGACPDLPETGCLQMTGLVEDQSVEVTCEADSFAVDDKWLTCSGDWGEFALYLAVTGSPPSQFAITAEYDRQFLIGLSWDSVGFQSHDSAYNYLAKDTHEQKGLRVSGVRYELVQEDDERQSFISATFAVHFSPRPSCSACPDVYLRGNLSAHLNP